MRPAFTFPVHDLDVAGRAVKGTIPRAFIDEALTGCEVQAAGPDGALDVHLSKSGNDVVVQGTITVDLTVPCARCLAPVKLDRAIPLTLLLVPAPDARALPPPRKRDADTREGPPAKAPRKGRREPPEEVEFTAADADLDTYAGEEVILDPFIREALLLEEPIFPLCSEACEGIRPPNAVAVPFKDPRLVPLVELAELARKQKTKE